jgi:hypothetical protein
MRSIVVQVSDEVAKRLAAEAALMNTTLEELASKRISLPWISQTRQRRKKGDGSVDFLDLATTASNAPSARKSVAQIDEDIQASRAEW